MLQRASLCRALIHEPQLLMLDEPFGALDQFTREELWSVMQDLWMTRKPTVLLVTHDLKEAAFLANRICVMAARPGPHHRRQRGAVSAAAHGRDVLRPEFRRADAEAARDDRACAATPRRPRHERATSTAALLRRRSSSASSSSGRCSASASASRDIVLPRPSQIIVHAGRALAGDLAARDADALHDAGRLRARHRVRRPDRRADRLVAARL